MVELKSTMTSTVISCLICLFSTSTVLACGPLPSGQEKILRFNVSGFTLPLPMVTVETVASRIIFPNASASVMEAQTFVHNLITRAMNDVLEQQGRSAGLSYDVISAILDQLTVNVTYEPLKCYSVSTSDPAQNNLRMNMKDNCLVMGNTVTSICTKMDIAMCMGNDIRAVAQQHISGNLRIRNIVMASWSDGMWRSIFSRVVRVLSSGPFSTNFLTASVYII